VRTELIDRPPDEPDPHRLYTHKEANKKVSQSLQKTPDTSVPAAKRSSGLLLSKKASVRRRVAARIGQGLLLLITSASSIAVLFIFYYVIRDSIPFFRVEGFKEFFTSTRWYPSMDPSEFGALAIIYGTFMVTVGAIIFSVPLGITAAVCLSDVLPFGIRQFVKPIIEILASIPSVAYGFFALVVLAPLMQQKGGTLLSVAVWVVGTPLGVLAAVVLGELPAQFLPPPKRKPIRIVAVLILVAAGAIGLHALASAAASVTIDSGTNALNVSIILGIMVLPTIVSVSEDALQAVGRELREGSYALGATRAETIVRVIIPAASSGIAAAIILGLMRAVGETMVVWMASGNAAKLPKPFYNFFEPVRTLTATIAGDMGEADHVTGSSRYHVLFAMATLLLAISFVCNLLSEWAVVRERRKLRGG